MKYHFRVPPWPHQREALEFLLRKRGGGLQIPMRFGKSKVGIDFACCMYHLENVRRVLVVTVTSGLGVWEDQVAQHCPLPYIVADQHAEILSRAPQVAHPKKGEFLQFMVVNFPNTYQRMNTGGHSWSAVPHQTLTKFKPELIIVDESHHIGDPSSVQFKMVNLLGREARFRVIMTGTMFHRKPFFTFGQMKFLDHGRSLGSDYGVYKKRIATMGGYMDYQVVRYRNLKWMTRQVQREVLIKKAPPKIPSVQNEVHFRLRGKNLEAYKEMDKHKVLKVGDETIVSPLILTKHLRLHMIEGGWIRLESGKYKQVGKDKLEVAKARLEEYMASSIEKAVVACRFIPELAGVAQAAKAVGYKVVLFHGALDAARRTARIKLFQKYKGPILFVSQIATGSQSIDLSCADTMMFYSLSESYLIHDQMVSRIEKYMEKRTLQYDYLIGRGTRGEVTFKALQLKKDVADFIVEKPRLVEKITERADLYHASSEIP